MALVGSQSALALNLEDVSANQQTTLMLKAALERAKLEKELSQMKDRQVSVSGICSSDGIGTLALGAIYGAGPRPAFAAFSYNSATQIEARQGDTLLCGEKVERITLDNVEVSKGGKTYKVFGSVTTLAGVTN
ncbi:type IV pilus biogenesis protein PilP [Serratia quinivorans]|nr:type IV pilus biogenesis protein PilP [Serratia quinivorans]CAI1808149.1 type IV pilus biogenesis protein PilP [Serratia quinivorans]